MKKTGKGLDHTTPQNAARHSEEVTMNDNEGYNETNPDAPINPDQAQKQEAKKMKKQSPSPSKNR